MHYGYNRVVSQENGLSYTIGDELDLSFVKERLEQLLSGSLKWTSKDHKIAHYARQRGRTPEATVAQLSCGIGIAVGCFQRNIISTFYVFQQEELSRIIERLKTESVFAGTILPLAELGFEVDYQKLQSCKNGLSVPGCYALQDIHTSPAPMTPCSWDGTRAMQSSRLCNLSTGYYLTCKKRWMFVPYHVHYMLPSMRPLDYISPWMLYRYPHYEMGIPTEGGASLYLVPTFIAEPPPEIRDAVPVPAYKAGARWGWAMLYWDVFISPQRGDIAINFKEIVVV